MGDLTQSTDISPTLLYNYFRDLVNMFFKILPMKENGEETLCVYMQSLQKELIGCRGVVDFLDNDGRIMALISILQYLIDFPECDVREVRTQVFHAISICNKIKSTINYMPDDKRGA